jgi:hypothetical protein
MQKCGPAHVAIHNITAGNLSEQVGKEGTAGNFLQLSVLVSHHHSQHSVPAAAARSVSVDNLGDHAELHRHVDILPRLWDVMLLLSTSEGKVRVATGVKDALMHRGHGPPGREESLDSLGFADKDAESLFGRALHVVDGAAHGISVEGVHILLAHAESIDQELKSLVLGAVVEQNIVGDGGEGLPVLVAILGTVIVHPVLLGFRLGRSLGTLDFRSARRLVSLPVSFLTGLVAVGDELATGTQQEGDVRLCAGCAAASLRVRHL